MNIEQLRWTPAVKVMILSLLGIWVVGQIVGQGVLFQDWFILSTPKVLDGQVWRLMSYALWHQNLSHLLLNLLEIWFFGIALERALGARRLWVLFGSCILAGGVAELLQSFWSGTPQYVAGASAGAIGFVVGFCILFPEALIYIFGIIPVKAKYLGYGIVGMHLLAGLDASSQGVAILAHLAGIGMAFVMVYNKWYGDLFFRSRRKKLKVVKGSGGGVAKLGGSSFLPKPRLKVVKEKVNPVELIAKNEEEVDRILDKIRISGMDSLTQKERRILKSHSDALNSDQR